MCRSQLVGAQDVDTTFVVLHHWLFVYSSIEHKKKVKKAMDMWSEKTCIKFERISKAQSKHTWDYVNIRYNDM